LGNAAKIIDHLLLAHTDSGVFDDEFFTLHIALDAYLGIECRWSKQNSHF
jgi:hypothetical protein